MQALAILGGIVLGLLALLGLIIVLRALADYWY